MIETNFSFILKNEKELRNFIQKEKYENFLKNILIQTTIFSNNLKLITEQSNGEGDFYDSEADISYEATLLLNSEIVSNIINDPAYLGSELFKREKTQGLIELFSKRLKSKENKNMSLILFNIFPDIFPKFEGSITDIYLMDEGDLIINKLLKENYANIKHKQLFLASFNFNGSFYVRKLHPKGNNIYYIRKHKETDFPFRIKDHKVNFYK